LGGRPEKIELEGKTFSFVTGQRGGMSAIYKSEGAYLRIGEEKKIAPDLALHRKMEAAGFPVTRLLGEGVFDGQKYFIESSLGEKHLGELFSEDTEQRGAISENLFESLVSVAEKFAEAQLTTIAEERNFNDFARGIWIDRLCEEIPASASKLKERFEEVKRNTQSIPFVVTHGDFNPNNLYPAGVIDLEDSFHAPYGYDLISAITHINSFPDSEEFEYFAKYRFTLDQISHYLERLDRISVTNNLPKLSTLLEDFSFCRAVWLAADIPATPKLQQFRYQLVIDQFLS